MPGSERPDAVIPDVTRQHWAVNIRKYVVRAGRLRDVVALGSLPRGPADFLDAALRAALNILVSGATQAGNPTSCQSTHTNRLMRATQAALNTSQGSPLQWPHEGSPWLPVVRSRR